MVLIVAITLANTSLHAQTQQISVNSTLITYSGTVTDHTGAPVMGATVVITGSQRGVVTDLSGSFSIEAAPGNTLRVSLMGLETQDVVLTTQSRLNIVMRQDVTLVDEVVVVGYGAQSSKLVTTSISRLTLDNVEQGSDINPVKMLQGRIAGVFVSSGSGKPGAQPNILVRGVGSISGNSSPLYVVDGIPSETMPVLNPGDIERMDVLKDASAAAIYGSRANSGVVIITTKSGHRGRTRVDLSGHYGLGWINNDIEMANAAQYQQVMQAAVDNYNAQKGTNEKLFVPKVIEDTDWMELIYRQPAVNASATFSVSGGDEKTLFYTSVGYNKQQGAVKTSDYDQFNMQAKLEHRINPIFNLKLNMRGSYSIFGLVEDTDGGLKVIRTAREEPAWYGPYYADGSYRVNGIEITRHNAVMLINEEEWRLSKKQGVVTAAVDITPLDGLKYTPSFSLYGILDEQTKSITEKHAARRYDANWSGLAEQKDVSHRVVVDNILSYDRQWGEFIFTAMAGHSFEKYQYEQFGAKGNNYANNAYPSSSFDVINAGPNIYPGSINYNAYAIESYFGRVALNFDNRYILNSTVRRDGSSRFSRDKRYGTFPSLSFAWRVTEEGFMPESSWLDDLKLRLSWGQTGSMAGIGDWAAMSLVGSNASSYNGAGGIRIQQDAQNLSWEKANQYNVGLDVEMFDGKLGFTVDAFHQKTTGLLYNKPFHSTSGYTSLTQNIGSLSNQGLELSVNGRIFDNGDFRWDMNANISFVRNKLLSLLGGQEILDVGNGHSLIVGHSLGAYYMLEMEGIYQRDSDVPGKLYDIGVRAGDVRFRDENNDGNITAADRVYSGSAMPRFYGGLTSNWRWKGFDLSVFCQYSAGGKVMATWRGNGEGTDHLGANLSSIQVYDEGNLVPAKVFWNVRKEMVDTYWRGEGTSNTTPRPVMNGAHSTAYNTQTSTRYMENGSYFKIKNITLAYSLPQRVNRNLGINGARFYVALDNFITFTKYSGYDPEFSKNASPSHSEYGIDFGELPTLKNVILGLNFNF